MTLNSFFFCWEGGRALKCVCRRRAQRAAFVLSHTVFESPASRQGKDTNFCLLISAEFIRRLPTSVNTGKVNFWTTCHPSTFVILPSFLLLILPNAPSPRTASADSDVKTAKHYFLLAHERVDNNVDALFTLRHLPGPISQGSDFLPAECSKMASSHRHVQPSTN